MTMCLSVCLSVSSCHTYIWNRMSKFSLLISYGRGSVLLLWLCDKLVLQVLWMKSCLRIMAMNRQREMMYVQSDSPDEARI